jgi:primosomal protein N' (replication factor Y)
MQEFVRVAVNVPSLVGVGVGARPETFDYRVPENLADRVGPGHLVVVPFGSRIAQGVVVEAISRPAVEETKEIIALVDPESVLTTQQIALAEWMVTSTLASMASIVGLFLPPGLSQQVDTVYSLNDVPAGNAAEDGPTRAAAARGDGMARTVARRLEQLLGQRGPLRGRQIDRAMPRVEWRRTAQYLVRRGMLESRSVLPPASVRPKFVRTAQLAATPEAAEQAMHDIGTAVATRLRRQKAMRFLIDHPEAINVSWVYAESGCNLTDLQELAERDLIMLREQEVWRDSLKRRESGDPNEEALVTVDASLTREQETAWRALEAGLASAREGAPPRPFLLQGVTGSGKTELYLRAALVAVGMGKQVVVLVPEISLTPQTVRRFLAHFPGQVGLIHSGLSEGERYDTWRRARAGLLQVIIGPRSALFAPLARLGLLIVDECHDASYYQSEPPFYDAVGVAQAYARLCRGVCILGSATPSVVQRFAAEGGQTSLLELKQRVASASDTRPAHNAPLPQVHVVDMREELRAGNRGSFSRELGAALDEVLGRREQAILFLNRRGTATYVFCRTCGYVARCPRCDTPLTYHLAGSEKLLCHRCGYVRQMPRKCPECGSPDIRAYGLGTERVEAEVQRNWPKARTLRWDWETTRQKDSHEVILQHFAAGRADVLIGTQMLAKGLDLPRVTLVGIVLADVGLFLPDPFAAERSFQLLTQVAGRAGRSSSSGQVVLQTFAPDNHVIEAASRHDVDGFYAQELAQRRRLGYPPFSELLRLEYRDFDAAKAEREAGKAAAVLIEQLEKEGRKQSLLVGPAPCFFAKLDGKYRWQIVLRGTDFRRMLHGRSFEHWRIEVNPPSLL